jgi:hypothetical protein
MLNAMMVGLVLARQRKVENPLVPALVAGMVPMPLGVVAAVLLTDSAKKEAETPITPTKPWFERYAELGKQLATTDDPAKKKLIRDQLFALQAAKFDLPITQLTEPLHERILELFLGITARDGQQTAAAQPQLLPSESELTKQQRTSKS